MEDIKEGLQEHAKEKSGAALVTIIGSKGSTPRKPGAKMLVFPDGRTFGTVGGGCGEAEIRREALNVLRSRQQQTYALNLTNDTAAEEGMVCGGIMEVFIEYLDGTQVEFWQECLKLMESKESFLMISLIKAKEQDLAGKRLLWTTSGKKVGDLGELKLNSAAGELFSAGLAERKPGLVYLDASGQALFEDRTEAAYQLFVENIATPINLVILGGGHIALPLSQMGKIIGYTITVVDDRPYFANSQRFASADRVICNAFRQALKEVEINPSTFVVIVTRGHKHDKECLREVIDKPAGYIGMIGSRRRVKALLGELAEEGIEQEQLNQVYSPIGLNIGAETPEEIAVSILGEIIRVQKIKR
ncbi:MAG: XdhC family protein [Desulfitobacteriaceae bacterium]